MRKLNEIAGDLRELLAPHYRSVRISTLQNGSQLLAELRAFNREKMPAVLIVYDGMTLTNTGTIREDRFSLVLVDRFRKDSDEQALSVLAATETLLELLPPDGTLLNGVWLRPEDCQAASPDPELAALALGMVAAQGI